MINWDQIKYDITKATVEYNSLNSINPIAIATNLSSEFKHIRKLLIQARDDIFDEYNLDVAEKLGYNFDLLFAIKLYEILGTNNNFCNNIISGELDFKSRG